MLIGKRATDRHAQPTSFSPTPLTLGTHNVQATDDTQELPEKKNTVSNFIVKKQQHFLDQSGDLQKFILIICDV